MNESSNVPFGVEHARLMTCGRCSTPCPGYLAGTHPIQNSCFSCPIGHWPSFGYCEEFGPFLPADRPRPGLQDRETALERTREHWAKLHHKALEGFDRAWLKEWEVEIARWETEGRFGKCACSQGYQALKAAMPVLWEDLFTWSVRIHNAVNRKLGKPEISIAQAWEIWKPAS